RSEKGFRFFIITWRFRFIWSLCIRHPSPSLVTSSAPDLTKRYRTQIAAIRLAVTVFGDKGCPHMVFALVFRFKDAGLLASFTEGSVNFSGNEAFLRIV